MTRVTLAAALLGSLALVQPADAQRTCRQDCVGPVCTEQCTEGPVVIERDRTDGRELRRERDADVVIEERRRLREPGIELRTPGVDIEIRR